MTTVDAEAIAEAVQRRWGHVMIARTGALVRLSFQEALKKLADALERVGS